jgi:hypothetical protein
LLNGVDGAGGVECVDGHEGLQIRVTSDQRLTKTKQISIGKTLVSRLFSNWGQININ